MKNSLQLRIEIGAGMFLISRREIRILQSSSAPLAHDELKKIITIETGRVGGATFCRCFLIRVDLFRQQET